ncbi:hypothetical protein LHJ74_28160 [Streptomyces sp. N2-109]|uniref:GNAT family N-acetyltransferase n=1 Tax=Streptomyces gossypii TaxID=2883101 RepID=A0ABT2K278_9ACTN|nr:hypothetical protein [Streptomyces gossypii]MCT2593001.1 hypothetical protein [Streptomyces gossypii]MCT2593734.1 hypothetical protein [Streptomyces gossypii]
MATEPTARTVRAARIRDAEGVIDALTEGFERCGIAPPPARPESTVWRSDDDEDPPRVMVGPVDLDTVRTLAGILLAQAEERRRRP